MNKRRGENGDYMICDEFVNYKEDIKTDNEIREMSGHPDIIPPQYREEFLKGYRKCEDDFKRNNYKYINTHRNTIYKGFSKEEIDHKILQANESLNETLNTINEMHDDKIKDLNKVIEKKDKRITQFFNMTVNEFRKNKRY